MLFDPDNPAKPVASGGRLQRTVGISRIGFTKAANGQTKLADLHQAGAAKIRLPKVHTGQHAEAVLINTAGGLTDGDHLQTTVNAGPGTDAVISTQACERIYAAATPTPAQIENKVTVEPGANLAWLPQETILFEGGRADRTLNVDLKGDATFLGVESLILGRLTMGETVTKGALRDRWQIRRDGQLIYADGFSLSGDIAAQVARPALLNGSRYLSTIVLCSTDAQQFLDPVREAIKGAGAASAFEGKLVARLVTSDGQTLRQILEQTLTLLRGGRPLPPVWHI